MKLIICRMKIDVLFWNDSHNSQSTDSALFNWKFSHFSSTVFSQLLFLSLNYILHRHIAFMGTYPLYKMSLCMRFEFSSFPIDDCQCRKKEIRKIVKFVKNEKLIHLWISETTKSINFYTRQRVIKFFRNSKKSNSWKIRDNHT